MRYPSEHTLKSGMNFSETKTYKTRQYSAQETKTWITRQEAEMKAKYPKKIFSNMPSMADTACQ